MQNVVVHLCSQVPARLRLSGAPISFGSIATSNFDPAYYAANSTRTQRYRVDVLYADGKRRGFRSLLLPVNVRCGEVPKVSTRGHVLAKWSLAWGLLASMRCGSPPLPPSSPGSQHAATIVYSDEELNDPSDDAARWRLLQRLRPPLPLDQPAPPVLQPRKLFQSFPRSYLQTSPVLVSSTDDGSHTSSSSALNDPLDLPQNSSNFSQLFSSSPATKLPESSSETVLHTVISSSRMGQQSIFSRQPGQFEHRGSSNPNLSHLVSPHVGESASSPYPVGDFDENSSPSRTMSNTLDSEVPNNPIADSSVAHSQLPETTSSTLTNKPSVSEAALVNAVFETSPTILPSSRDMPRVQERRHNSATESGDLLYETMRERMPAVHYKDPFLDHDVTPTQQPTFNLDDGEHVGEMLPQPEPLNSILDVSGKHEGNDLEVNEDPHNHSYILRCAESATLSVDGVEARVTSHMGKALFFLCALLSSAQGARTAEFDFGPIRTVESYRTEDVALFGDGDDSLDVLYEGNANPGTGDVNIFWQTCRPDPPGPEFSLDSGPLLPRSIVWSLFSKVRCGGDRDDSSAGADRYFNDDVFPEEISSEEVAPSYSNWHNYVIRCVPGNETLLVDGMEMLMTAHMDSALSLLCFSSGLHGLNATRK